jgi:hypothetical protein
MNSLQILIPMNRRISPIIIKKWGQGPLMQHNVYDCPYYVISWLYYQQSSIIEGKHRRVIVMKRYVYTVFMILLTTSLCACRSIREEGNEKEQDTSLQSSFQSTNPNKTLNAVENEIYNISNNIETVKILFASSSIESSSLDIVIVILTTVENTRISENDEKSIISVINNSEISGIIDYKDVQIQYE